MRTGIAALALLATSLCLAEPRRPLPVVCRLRRRQQDLPVQDPGRLPGRHRRRRRLHAEPQLQPARRHLRPASQRDALLRPGRQARRRAPPLPRALRRLFPPRRKFEERRRRANLAAEFVTLAFGLVRVRLDALQHHGGSAADTLRCRGPFIDRCHAGRMRRAAMRVEAVAGGPWRDYASLIRRTGYGARSVAAAEEWRWKCGCSGAPGCGSRCWASAAARSAG